MDVDSAHYVGDGTDGVYYDAAPHRGKWYASALVDSDTGHFVDSLFTDDGPHDTEEEALRAGRNGATEWCFTNDVSIEEN